MSRGAFARQGFGMTAAQALPQLRPAPAAPSHRRRLRSLSPHVLLVANANASGIVRNPDVVASAGRLLRSAGAQVETRSTASLDELAALLPAAERRVVLLGGDGSLHAAANVPGPKPELALVPAGGANNVARSLGIPSDLAAAARLAVSGSTRALDLIEARNATSRYLVVEGVSVGFHALARADYRGTNSADLVAGVRAGLGALARFAPLTVGVEAEGEFHVLRIGQLFAVNLPYFGPGLQVAPGADPADGLLDLVVIDVQTRASLVSVLRRLRNGTHVGLPGVARLSTRSLRIATGGRSPIIADTTNLGTGTVELTVQPAALEIVGGPQ
jgi:diacylglycerol kinase (ATP)